MARKVTIALVGAGMFGGDIHARAYADLQRNGISGLLGRVGLDAWARDLAERLRPVILQRGSKSGPSHDC